MPGPCPRFRTRAVFRPSEACAGFCLCAALGSECDRPKAWQAPTTCAQAKPERKAAA